MYNKRLIDNSLVRFKNQPTGTAAGAESICAGGTSAAGAAGTAGASTGAGIATGTAGTGIEAGR